MKNKIICGDSIEVLRGMPENSVDSIVTDPPYGISFMAKGWDYEVPKVEIWKECFRVLKPGGHLLSFAGTRTHHRMAVNIEDAGFEIRDMIFWCYGSGFPKSMNIEKAVNKLIENKGSIRNELIDKGNFTYKGYGTALKPALEPITVARKPISEKNIAENVLKYGTGGINIDGCRIPTGENLSKNYNSVRKSDNEMGERVGRFGFRQGKDSSVEATESTLLGRFPTNLILTHHPECICNGYKKIRGSNCKTEDIGKGRNGNFSKGIYAPKQSKITTAYTDNDGFKTVEKWICHKDCPLAILDKQSGITKSTGGRGVKSMGGLGKNGIYNRYDLNISGENHGGLGDIGGATRFFYCAKASKSEKGIYNNHPTVKPIKLMSYLIRLVTPKGGIVLDPFGGSGTTACSAVEEGLNYIIIEREQSYVDIINKRVQDSIAKNKTKSKIKNKPKEKEVNMAKDEKNVQLKLFDDF